MRILFLTSTLPFPPIGGEKLRPFYFLKYLALKHKISLFSFVGKEQELRAIRDYKSDNIDVHTVVMAKLQSYLKCIPGIFSHLPLEVHYYACRKMQDLIYRQLNVCKFDLIFCHLVRMAQYVKDIKIKKVLDISDALSLRYQLSYGFRRDIFKLIEKVESNRLRYYEPGVIRRFDLCCIASSKDREYFEMEMQVKNLSLVPNGVHIEDVSDREITPKPNKIVFFGNMRAFPNRDALLYFCKEIFPLIKQKIKEARLTIVGANVSRNILSLKRRGSIDIFYDTPQIKTFVEDACVSIAPMRIAVGIQNKILQSMAFKVPVVTTTIGLGGIEAKPERDILLADSPEEFSRKVVLLMQDKELRDYIANNAYQLVKEKYCWTDIVERLSAECLKLIS